jgi:hypothetical protein
MQNQSISNEELTAHSALIIEGSLVPAVTAKGEIKLQMTRELVGNEYLFLKGLFNVISGKCEITDYPFVEEFRRDIAVHSNNRFNKLSRQRMDDHDMGMGGDMSNMRGKPAKVAHHHIMPIVDTDLPSDVKGTSSRIDYEKSEPIVRLLAQVRKVGMDILFPQSTHDKILVCIFVAIKSSITPAHRELIDMVMAVRDAGQIGKLDHVSKTKVRGVLALLKHGELLVTQGEEGEPVRLFLARGINSIEDLRVRHDAFITRYMVEHHSFIPAILKSELVWQFEEDTKRARLTVMNELSLKLDNFYKNYIERLLTQSAAQVSQPENRQNRAVSVDSHGNLMQLPENRQGRACSLDSHGHLLQLPEGRQGRAVSMDSHGNMMGMSGEGMGQHHLDPYSYDGSGAPSYSDMQHRRMERVPNVLSNIAGGINPYDVINPGVIEFGRQSSSRSISSMQTDNESRSSERTRPGWKSSGTRTRQNSNPMTPYTSPYPSPYLSPRDGPSLDYHQYSQQGGRDLTNNRMRTHHERPEIRMVDVPVGYDQNYHQGVGGVGGSGSSDPYRGENRQLMDNGEYGQQHLTNRGDTDRMSTRLRNDLILEVPEERFDEYSNSNLASFNRGGVGQPYSTRQGGSASYNKGYISSVGHSANTKQQYNNGSRTIPSPSYDSLPDQQRQSRLQKVGAPPSSHPSPRDAYMQQQQRYDRPTGYSNLVIPPGGTSGHPPSDRPEISPAGSVLSDNPDSPRVQHLDGGILNNGLAAESPWQFGGLYGLTVAPGGGGVPITSVVGSSVGIADHGTGPDPPKLHHNGQSLSNIQPQTNSPTNSHDGRVPMLNVHPRKNTAEQPHPFGNSHSSSLLGLDLLGSELSTSHGQSQEQHNQSQRGGSKGPSPYPSSGEGMPSPRDAGGYPPRPEGGYPSSQDSQLGGSPSRNKESYNEAGRYHREKVYQYSNGDAGPYSHIGGPGDGVEGRRAGDGGRGPPGIGGTNGPGGPHQHFNGGQQYAREYGSADRYHSGGGMEQGPMFAYPSTRRESDDTMTSLTNTGDGSVVSKQYSSDEAMGERGMPGSDLMPSDEGPDLYQGSYQGPDLGYTDHYHQPDELSSELQSNYLTHPNSRPQQMTAGLPDDFCGLQQMSMAFVPTDTPRDHAALASTWTAGPITAVASVVPSMGSDVDQGNTPSIFESPPALTPPYDADTCENAEHMDRIDSLLGSPTSG